MTNNKGLYLKSLENISASFNESDLIKGQLLQINNQHLKTGCEGALSVFVEDQEIAPVVEIIDSPELLTKPVDVIGKNDYKASDQKPEDIVLVQGLDNSVSYTTQSLNLRVGCDCCDISWERATKGLFKSPQTKNSGKNITYFLEVDTPYTTTSSSELFSNYNLPLTGNSKTSYTNSSYQ